MSVKETYNYAECDVDSKTTAKPWDSIKKGGNEEIETCALHDLQTPLITVVLSVL